jgi:hypothetical protein
VNPLIKELVRKIVKYDEELVESKTCNKVDVIKDMTRNIHIKKREILDITLKKDGNKTVLVILMNPSRADDIESDKTIKSLIKYFSQFSYPVNNEKDVTGAIRVITNIKKICVRNLFSIYNPNPRNLNNNIDQIINFLSYDALNKMIEINQLEIEKAISDSDYIVLGWGDCPSNFHVTTFHHQIVKIMEFIMKEEKDQLFVFHVINNRAKKRGFKFKNILTDGKNPVHPSIGEIIGLQRVKIDSIYRILPMS